MFEARQIFKVRELLIEYSVQSEKAGEFYFEYLSADGADYADSGF
jgi:hypothetical protein